MADDDTGAMPADRGRIRPGSGVVSEAPATRLAVSWAVLTQGDRPDELEHCLDSIRRVTGATLRDGGGETTPDIVVVLNGGDDIDVGPDVRLVRSAENLGVPGGRNLAARHCRGDIIVFVDDDGVLAADFDEQRIVARFASDHDLGAIAFRIVDEHGRTQRRHVPRFGGRSADRPGPVAVFLGGAVALRRDAYCGVGGYWDELFYGHEELELSWRMIDRGWTIYYDSSARLVHPSTPIGRHAEGWYRTGRNRVWIARRNLPTVLLGVHTACWLVLGVFRAPTDAARRAVLSGWRNGWSEQIERRPIRWGTVWKLTALRRPPVL